MKGLIAKKVGMTQIFDENGNLIPVTVISVEPNTVVATRTREKCGYDAVVLGTHDMKAQRVTKPYAAQFPEGVPPKRELREFRDFESDGKADIKAGDKIGIELFEGTRFVDVTAVSKGRGYQGVMKRWGFHGGPGRVGSKFHRAAGGTGMCTTPGHTFKNTKMAGRMGAKLVTVQNLRVVQRDAELGVLLVRGAVPGVNGSYVIVRSAVKK